MYAMRDRLLSEAANEKAVQAATVNRKLDETARLAAALAKLESTQTQLRTLQATLIAEKVARTQLQERADVEAGDMKECRDELAAAIRALKRSRDEGQRGDDEKKSLAKSVEALRLK